MIDFLVSKLIKDSTRLLTPVEQAALILECAEDGQKLQDEVLSENIRFCYRWRKKLHLLFRCAAWAILLIHVFEYPIWTFRRSDDTWKNGAVYPSYQMTYLPVLASTLLDGLCVLILWFAVLLELGYHGKSRHRRMTQALSCALALHSCSILMQLAYSIIGTGTLFNTAPIATFFVILVERKYDRHVGYILRLLPRFLLLLLLVAFAVILFTIAAFLIFPTTSGEIAEFFPNFGTGMWNMLMVLNGSDWPIPMMPAFDQNRAYALFFYTYIILGDWIVLNIVLGFVYLFFRIEQTQIVQREKDLSNRLHDRAFALLDTEKCGRLQYDQIDALVVEVYACYKYTMTLPDAFERHELLLQLDEEAHGYIDRLCFRHIHSRCFGGALRVLRAKVTKVQRFVSVVRDQPSASLTGLSRQRRQSRNSVRGSFSGSLGKIFGSLSQSLHSLPLQPLSSTNTNASQAENQCRTDRQSVGGAETRESRDYPHEDKEEEDSRRRTLSSAASVYGRLDNRVVEHLLSQQTHSSQSLAQPSIQVTASKRLASASFSSAKSVSISQPMNLSQTHQPQIHLQYEIQKKASCTYKSHQPDDCGDDNRVLNYQCGSTNNNNNKDNCWGSWVQFMTDNCTCCTNILGSHCFNSGRHWRSKLAMMIDSFTFDLCSDSVIDLFGVLCLSRVDCARPATHIVFAIACCLESFCKASVKGLYRYYKSYRNFLDGLLTLTILILMLTTPRDHDDENDYYLPNFCDNFILQSIILVRVVLWPRNILASKQFAAFRHTHRLAFAFAFQTASQFSFLFLCLFVFLYGFAALGQQLFGGAIVKTGTTGTNIAQSEYGSSGYWPLNFNDMPSGLVTMFVLLHVNNMHVTTSGFVASLGQSAELFFAAWYALGVLFMLNIVTAVIINQFVGYLESLRRQQEQRELLALQAVEQRESQLQQILLLGEEEQQGQGRGDISKEKVLLLAGENNSNEDAGSDRFKNTPIIPVVRTGQIHSQIAQEKPEKQQKQQQTLPASLAEDDVVGPFAQSIFASSQKRRDLSRLIAAHTPILQTHSDSLTSSAAPGSFMISNMNNDSNRSSVITTANNNSNNRDLNRSASASPFSSSAGNMMTPSSSARSPYIATTLSLSHFSPYANNTLMDMDMRHSERIPSQQSTNNPLILSPIHGTKSSSNPNTVFATKSSFSLLTFALNNNNNVNSQSKPVTSSLRTPLLVADNSPVGGVVQSSAAESGYGSMLSTSANNGNIITTNKMHIVSTDNANNVTYSKSNDTDAVGNQSYSHGRSQQLERELLASLQSCDTRIVIGDHTVEDDDIEDEDDDVQHNDLLLGKRDTDSDSDTDGDQENKAEENDSRSNSDSLLISQSSQSVLANNYRMNITSNKPQGLQVALTLDTTGASDGLDPIVIGLAMQSMINPSNNANIDDASDTSNYNNPLKRVDNFGNNSYDDDAEDEDGYYYHEEDGSHATTKSAESAPSSVPVGGWQEWMFGTRHISPLQRAAVLVQFAREGSQKVLHGSARSLACFRWHSRLATLLRLAAAAFAFLRFFSRPLWTFRPTHASDWQDTSVYPRSGVPLLPSLAEGWLKLPLLLVLLTGLILEVGYKEALDRDWWTVRQLLRLSVSRCVRLCLVLYNLAMCLVLIYALCVLTAASINNNDNDDVSHRTRLAAERSVSVTSLGAIIYVLWFNRRSLNKLKVVLRILPRLCAMLVVLLLVVLVFAGFGPLIFRMRTSNNGSSADDDTYFNNFNDASWSVFVAITSSSYPNQVMPSYRRFREVALYFVSFISVGSFLLLNLVVVIVLVEFQRNSQNAADVLRANRRILLMRAFALLAVPNRNNQIHGNQGRHDQRSNANDTNHNTVSDQQAIDSDKTLAPASQPFNHQTRHQPAQPQQQLVVPTRRMLRLLDALRDQYGDFARAGIPKGEARLVLLEILDVDGDGHIGLSDFLFLLDVVRIRLDLTDQQHSPVVDTTSNSSNGHHCNNGLVSIAQQWRGVSVTLAQSRLLDIVVDLTCVIIILTSLIVNRNDLYKSTASSRLFFLLVTLLCVGHMALKCIVLGIKETLLSFRNRFDIIITVLLLVSLICDTVSELSDARTDTGSDSGRHFASEVTGWTRLARCLLLLKLVVSPRNLRAWFLLLSQHRLHLLNNSNNNNNNNNNNDSSSSSAAVSSRRQQRRQWQREVHRLRRYQRFIAALSRLLRRILTKTLTLGIVFLCVGYSFASLGELVFGGAIRYDLSVSHADFASSTYASNNLYTLNFNDFLSATLTLFCCLKVSDFDVIASGFSSSVSLFGARCFFAAWYVLGVLLLLNVVKSFFLGEFLTLFAGRSNQQNHFLAVDKGSAANNNSTGDDNSNSNGNSSTTDNSDNSNRKQKKRDSMVELFSEDQRRTEQQRQQLKTTTNSNHSDYEDDEHDINNGSNNTITNNSYKGRATEDLLRRGLQRSLSLRSDQTLILDNNKHNSNTNDSYSNSNIKAVNVSSKNTSNENTNSVKISNTSRESETEEEKQGSVLRGSVASFNYNNSSARNSEIAASITRPHEFFLALSPAAHLKKANHPNSNNSNPYNINNTNNDSDTHNTSNHHHSNHYDNYDNHSHVPDATEGVTDTSPPPPLLGFRAQLSLGASRALTDHESQRLRQRVRRLSVRHHNHPAAANGSDM